MKPWAVGPGVELGLLVPEISVHFYLPHGHGTSPFHVSTCPTSLDGCRFFNSIVVRLPFNSISDDSEWWLFYILVASLMWLCKEVSCVCLCHHLDWKCISLTTFLLLLYEENIICGGIQLSKKHWLNLETLIIMESLLMKSFKDEL